MASTPIISAAEVSAPGMETLGVVSPGSDSHIITTTRRYGKARTMLVTTPAMTSQVCAAVDAPPRTPRTCW